MDREELKTKINEVLGSTKLTLSERTINDFLDDALVGITDDDVTDDFVSRKANMLKSIDGNLHSDVSEQVRVYMDKLPKSQEPKSQEPKPDTKPTGDEKPQEPADNGVSKEIEELKKRLKSFEDDRKKADEAKKREKELAELKDAFTARFDEAGAKVNTYILKQTLRDFDGDGSVSDKVKALEGKYYENLKEAGFDYDSPMAGGINANNSGIKSKREAFKEEMRSRGMLPKQDK
jgi:hypothetical protein